MLKGDELRITVLAALAWRAIAEIARHQHPTHELAIEQFHPGISPRGVIRLALASRSGGNPSATFAFELGGPEPGTWRVTAGDHHGEEDFLQLLGLHPRVVVADMLREAGFPAPGEALPPSSDRVLAMRLVAGLLERKVFSARAWRSTCAVYGNQGGYSVADWHRPILGTEYRAGPWGEFEEDAIRRLSDLVVVHPLRDGEEAPVHETGSLAGTGIVLDLESGSYGSLSTRGWKPIGDVRTLYDRSRGAMRKMVDELDSLTED